MATRARASVRPHPESLADLFRTVRPKNVIEREALERLERNWIGYDHQCFGSLESLRETEPRYASRLEFAIEESSGVCLEIGPSIGAMSRRIAMKDDVLLVVGCDISPVAQRCLAAARIPKVFPALHTPERPLILPEGLVIDTLILCEVIEHIETTDEIRLLEHFSRWCDDQTRFVISTPIGWMPDPEHVRGFSRDEFLFHVERIYGTIDRLDDGLSYSQSAAGYLTRLADYRTAGLESGADGF